MQNSIPLSDLPHPAFNAINGFEPYWLGKWSFSLTHNQYHPFDWLPVCLITPPWVTCNGCGGNDFWMTNKVRVSYSYVHRTKSHRGISRSTIIPFHSSAIGGCLRLGTICTIGSCTVYPYSELDAEEAVFPVAHSQAQGVILRLRDSFSSLADG